MRLTKQQFIDQLTPTEMVNILAASRVSPEVEAWIFRFNNLTPEADGTSIDLNDARTISGLHAMEAGGLLGDGRANEILNAQPLEVEQTILEGTANVYEIDGAFMVCSPGEASPAEYSRVWNIPAFLIPAIAAGARVQNTDGKLELTVRFE